VGRDDVRAQEWSDLDKIISEDASSRSANDQQVYDWFQGLMQQQQINAAQDAHHHAGCVQRRARIPDLMAE